MLSEEIRQAVNAELEKLQAQIGANYNLRTYQSLGGQQSLGPWTATGIYTWKSKQSRLVLEVFSREADEIVVIRVYLERHSKILWAKKLTGGPERLESALSSAAEIFLTAIPRTPQKGSEVDGSNLPPELQAVIGFVFMPIPPTMSVSQIEEF